MADARLLEMKEGNSTQRHADIRNALAISIQEKLPKSSPSPTSCCIFRVPKALHEHNKDAYEPFAVSIGPLHHGKEHLQFMEQVKSWYLKSLLSRVSQKCSIHLLVDSVQKAEKDARNHYDERINYTDEEFIEMLILDGCFIIELFRKFTKRVKTDDQDPVFNRVCMIPYIKHDLFLLENQLPWSILDRIFKLTTEPEKENQCIIELTKKSENQNQSLPEIAIEFFQSIIPHLKHPSTPETLHILDLIWDAITASLPKDAPPGTAEKMKLFPNVRELLKHGVDFETGKEEDLLKVQFKNGKFIIPPLQIDEMTEPLLRNLIAYEQQYHKGKDKITSYAILMDRLIDSETDVHYLRKKECINLWLSEEDAASMFNGLYYDAQINDFYYYNICQGVEKHIKERRHLWKAMLKNDYFDNPWTALSCLAAVILLLLTLLQTFCTIKETWKL